MTRLAPISRRSSGKATLEDVARLAGVSTMTVSRVLNQQGHVRKETRKTVEGAIRELNYVPNLAAKALQAREDARRIAFLFDTPNAAVLGEMIGNGLDDTVPLNVKLVFLRARAQDDPVQTLGTLENLDIGGVILSPPLSDDTRLRILLARAGIRMVAIASSDGDPQVSTIGIDDGRAAYELTSHLIGLGHRRIGLITGNPRHSSSERRRAGYEAALLRHGLAADPALQWQGDYTFGTALAVAEEVLALDPPVSAVFASNDDMAAAMMCIARGRGIAVPKDLSVCGFDDSEIALMMSPQLTTVRQPMNVMAGWAVRQLAEEFDAIRRGTEVPVRKELLSHAIIYRESHAPPPDAGPSAPMSLISKR